MECWNLLKGGEENTLLYYIERVGIVLIKMSYFMEVLEFWSWNSLGSNYFLEFGFKEKANSKCGFGFHVHLLASVFKEIVVRFGGGCEQYLGHRLLGHVLGRKGDGGIEVSKRFILAGLKQITETQSLLLLSSSPFT